VCLQHLHQQLYIIILKKKKQTIKISYKEGDWVKLNSGQSGFYRVKYSASLSSKLGSAINSLSLPPGDRLGIQNDAFALARAGIIPLVQALELSQNYINETEYPVWVDLATNLLSVGALLSSTDANKYYDKFILALFTKIGSKLGWNSVEGEKDMDKLLRAVVLGVLGGAGDSEVVQHGKKYFEEYKKEKKGLSNDLMGVVFKLAVANGGEEEFNLMIKYFKESTQPEETIRTLRCIGYAKDEKLILKALEYLISGEVRTQDVFILANSCVSSANGRLLTWNFVKSNWEKLLSMLSGGNFLLTKFVSLADGFATEEKAKEVEEFFSKNSQPSIERTISQTLETIRANSSYLNNNLEPVTTWLKSHFS